MQPMGRLFQRGLITGVILLICSGYLYAQTAYVSPVNEITMRTEPGVENRIVEILKSGVPLTIIDHGKDWSKVESHSGKQGWVLTRFITEDRPKHLIVDELTEKNNSLTRQIETLSQENKTLLETNDTLKDIERKYNKLKEDSVEFFNLQEEHNQIREKYSQKEQQVAELESRLRNDDNIFFLCGAGVFIFGLILGISTRKKRRNSLI